MLTIGIAYAVSLIAASAIGVPLMMRNQKKQDAINVKLYIK